MGGLHVSGVPTVFLKCKKLSCNTKQDIVFPTNKNGNGMARVRAQPPQSTAL